MFTWNDAEVEDEIIVASLLFKNRTSLLNPVVAPISTTWKRDDPQDVRTRCLGDSYWHLDL